MSKRKPLVKGSVAAKRYMAKLRKLAAAKRLQRDPLSRLTLKDAIDLESRKRRIVGSLAGHKRNPLTADEATNALQQSKDQLDASARARTAKERMWRKGIAYGQADMASDFGPAEMQQTANIARASAAFFPKSNSASGPADEDAARELELYIENDADLYRQQYTPIIANLMRKRAAGKYDHDLAVKLFMYLVESGAKKYSKEFSAGTDWSTMFNKNTRLVVAASLRDKFEVEAGYGNYDGHIPAKYRKNPLTKTESNSLLARSAETLKLARRQIREGYPVMGSMHAGMAFAHGLDVEQTSGVPIKRTAGGFLKARAYEVAQPAIHHETRERLGLRSNPLVMTVMGNPSQNGFTRKFPRDLKPGDKQAIRRIVSSFDVATPEESLATFVMAKIQGSPTDAEKAAVFEYAIKCHRENQKLATGVARGMMNPGLCQNPGHRHRRRNPLDYQDVYSAAQKVGHSIQDAARVATEFKRTGELPRTVEAQLRYFKNPSQTFDVFLDGKHIDTIHYGETVKVDVDEVKRSLVGHDGYDPDIEVKKRRATSAGPRGPLHPHTCFRCGGSLRAGSVATASGRRVCHDCADDVSTGGQRRNPEGEDVVREWLPVPKDPRKQVYARRVKGTFKEALRHAQERAGRWNTVVLLYEIDLSKYPLEGSFKEVWAIARPHGGYEIVKGKQTNPGFWWRVRLSFVNMEGQPPRRMEQTYAVVAPNQKDAVIAAEDIANKEMSGENFKTMHVSKMSGPPPGRGAAFGLQNGSRKSNPSGVSRVVGIEIEPVQLRGASASVVARKDANTFSVYTRRASGLASWVKDFKSLPAASSFARALAKKHGIKVTAPRLGKKYETNPSQGTRRKVTMTLEAFAKMVKAKNDPKLWAAFLKKVNDYKKWSHGTLPKKVTVEQVDVPGMSGMWMTYDAGKAPETAYIMPKGTKRKGAWVHQWDTMPDIKNDPDSGIVLTKLKGKSRITDFYHR